MENWNFKREVKGCDHTHGPIRPSVAGSKLALMVSRRALRLSKIPNLISAEIFEKVNSDFELSMSLSIALRAYSLC